MCERQRRGTWLGGCWHKEAEQKRWFAQLFGGAWYAGGQDNAGVHVRLPTRRASLESNRALRLIRGHPAAHARDDASAKNGGCVGRNDRRAIPQAVLGEGGQWCGMPGGLEKGSSEVVNVRPKEMRGRKRKAKEGAAQVQGEAAKNTLIYPTSARGCFTYPVGRVRALSAPWSLGASQESMRAVKIVHT